MNRKFKNILFTFFLFLLVDSILAQEIYFKNPNYEMGGQRGISQVIQDQYGFIWIVGMEGLFRFDGNELYKIKSFSSRVLNFNDYSLLLGENDQLWVGTTQGLFYINLKTLKIQNIDLGTHSLVQNLYKGKGNTIWLGMKSGLIKLNSKSLNYTVFSKQNSGLTNNTVRAVYEDTKGTLWVGTENKLNILLKGASEFTNVDLKGTYKPQLRNNLILDIKPYSDSNDTLLWIGTETGLCLYNAINGNINFYRESNAGLSNEVVKAIYCTKNDDVWLGTDNGLNILNVKSGLSTSYLHNALNPTSIINDVIWDIFEDDAGIIWLSTSNGISKVIPEQGQFNFYMVKKTAESQPGGVQTYDILSVDGVNYWLATNGGVIHYNSKNREQKYFNTESGLFRQILINKVNTLHLDRLGRLWIGTVGGINLWNPEQNRMETISDENNQEEDAQRGYTSRFIESSNGKFYVSYWGKGLFEIKGDFSSLNNLQFQQIVDLNTNLIVSGNDYLWAIDNNKLYKIDPIKRDIIDINSVNKYSSTINFASLLFSNRGTVLIGAHNALLEYDEKKDSTIVHGLEGNKDISIFSLIEDDYGNIWGSTYSDILRLNIKTDQIETFNFGDIIPIGGFLSNSVNKAMNGDLAFGCNNGFVSFSPENMKINDYKPNVVISALKVDGRTIVPGETLYKNKKLDSLIPFTDEIHLDYKNNSFTLEFSSLHFGKKSGNIYSYKLEGYDSEWHTTSSDRNFVSYSNLLPKSYVFKLKGTNNEGVWQEQESKLGIRIMPPLWLRWYFIAAVLLLIIGIIITILYFFWQKRKLAREVLIEQAEKRNIAALNQAKLQFFTNISHEFRTPLSLIVGPVKKLTEGLGPNEESRQMVDLISKNANRMLRLVNQLMDFRKISSSVSSLAKAKNNIVQLSKDTFDLFIENAKEKGIRFHFISNCSELYYEFDKAKVETILFNLFSNAFKYTAKGEIKFNLIYINDDTNGGQIELNFSDTGRGIDKEQLTHIFNRFYRVNEQEQIETGTGIGLNIVKEFVELHQGKIEVYSTVGKGTIFKVVLPAEHIIQWSTGKLEYKIDVEPKRVDQTGVVESIQENSDEKTILIVEDNIEMAGFIASCLKSKYRVFIENNGAEGVEKAIELLPDLVISDIMMPLKSGTELCAELKSNINTSHIPVILLTALDSTEHKKEGYFIGADDYISKPFDEDLLLARIKGLLKNRELLQKKFLVQNSTDPKKLAIGTQDQDFLRKLMQVIEDNIHERDLSAVLLTNELGMSHSVVYKKLKALTGQSIIDFIRDFKLKRAAQLLSEHGFSVADACYKVGFSDRRYFTKVFKQKFGKSPSEYKKS